MSIRWLPREMGLIICCNGTGDKGCPKDAKAQTANIVAKHNRAHAKKSGWGRGLRKGYKRRDLCPTCMPIERELHAKEKADAEAWKVKRDENRKAKLLEKKAARAKKAASPEVTDSLSAGFVPAPAT
jgi:hypothetical protein